MIKFIFNSSIFIHLYDYSFSIISSGYCLKKKMENIDVCTEYQAGWVLPSWFCFSFNILNAHKSLYVLTDSYSASVIMSYVLRGNFRRTKILNFLQKILLHASIFPQASVH